MQLSLQPFTTAGIALVGASAIALSPLAPPPVTASATTTVSTAAVQLSAASSFVDPIAYWGDVLELTNTNLSKIFAAASAEPFPVVRQIVSNQTGYMNTIGTALTATAQKLEVYFTSDAVGNFKPAITRAKDLLAQGDLTGSYSQISGSITVLGTAAYPMLPLLAIPYEVVQNAANILKALSQQGTNFGITAKVAFGLLGAAQLAGRSTATTLQTIVDAAETRDPISIASAIINSPAQLTDAFLNGPLVVLPNGNTVRGKGFLSLGSYQSGLNWNPISAMIYVPRAIAAAITPPATAAADVATTAAPLALTAKVAPEATADGELLSTSRLTESQVVARGTVSTAESVSSAEAEDLSVANKVEDETAKAPSAQRVKASLDNAADKVDERIKKLSSGIEKSVKKVTDNLAKAGKKKQTAGSTSSANAPNKAGTDSDA